MEGAVARCPHCEALVEGPHDRFCCSGCEAAAALLHELDLDGWYAQREGPGGKPNPIERHDWSLVHTEAVADGVQACVMIDGLRCSSCVWVVERVLERTPGIQAAHVSYASGRATFTWDPEQTSLERLTARVSTLGYDPRPVDAAAPPDPLFPRLGVALFCTANLMLLTAGLYASWADGMEPRFQALFRWLALALSTPVALYSAEPFWKGAISGLRVGRLGMDVPIALSVGVLFVHGVVQTVLGAEAYLDSLGMLVTLLLVGRILESRGRRHTADAAAAVAARLPSMARRRTPTGYEDVSSSELLVDDVLELGAGAEIAADATVVEGELQVDASMLTGESQPKRCGPGDVVWAGSRVLEGTGGARVVRVGGETIASSMASALRQAIDKPAVDNPAEGLAPAFTFLSLGVAAVAGTWWTLTSGLHDGIQVAVAVLVVACPCALGLAVPLAVSNGLGALARRGIVLRDGDALLRLADVQQVAVDKTGTLTLGEPVVLEASDDILRVAAGLERVSHHPVANAIAAEARRRGIALPWVEELEETAGIGVAGRLDGAWWTLRSGGVGRVELARDGEVVGAIVTGDQLRADVAATVEALRSAGVEVTVLSGDVEEATRSTSVLAGIEEHHGALMPDDKAAWVRARPNVLFVGDGLNDGPALAAAHVGLAMQRGVGVSLGVADGIVVGEGLAPVEVALRGAKATRSAIRVNLRRSVAYNVLAVGLAAAGWVNPLVAAVLMPLSSAMVWWGSRSAEAELAMEPS